MTINEAITELERLRDARGGELPAMFLAPSGLLAEGEIDAK